MGIKLIDADKQDWKLFLYLIVCYEYLWDTLGYKCCFKYLFRFVIICGSLDVRYNITVAGTRFEMKNNNIIFNIFIVIPYSRRQHVEA